MHNLSDLLKLKGKTRKAKRVGQGIGSGKGGHTSGRGQKGQKSRTGFNLPVGFEGGQVPMFRRMPHLGGFVSKNKVETKVFNLGDFVDWPEAATVNRESLIKNGYLTAEANNPLKILGTGKLTKKLNFEGFTYSKSALEAIQKLGGLAK